MPNDLTVKDVLYALEYLGDALVRAPVRNGRAKWQMRGSGLHVKDSVADAVRANGSTQSINDLALQVVKWKSAA
jgi:hypothetical protein